MTVFACLAATILLGSIADSAIAYLSKCVMKYRIKRGYEDPCDMVDDFVVLLEDRYLKLNDDREAA